MNKPGYDDKQVVLFVIAHPDDESMFFLPSISNFIASKWSVHILCLSNGSSGSDGSVREKELFKAAACLNINRNNVEIINDSKLEDGMDCDWPAETVSAYVCKSVCRFKPCKIVTFDNYGVSGHPNHIAVSKGVQLASETIMSKCNFDESSSSCTKIEFLYLESVPLLRKYLGIIDILLSILLSTIVVINFNLFLPIRAMSCHKSQLVWYRYLWIFASRYEYVNTFNLKPR